MVTMNRYRGLALMELMLVVGVAALATAGAVMLFQVGMAKSAAHMESRKALAMVDRIEAAYQPTGNFRFLDTNAALVQNLVPKELRDGQGIRSRWGSVTVAEVPVGSRPFAGFRLTYGGVPPRACVVFIEQMSGAARSAWVNNIQVLSRRDGLNSSILAGACGMGGEVRMDFSPFHGIKDD